MSRILHTPNTLISLTVFLILSSLAIHTSHMLGSGRGAPAANEELYLPSGKGLSLFSVGYKNVLADIIWFKTINYFGREFRSTQNYEFLVHYVNLVTDLNPHLEKVYIFGAVMFAWELHQPNESIKLLEKAEAELPEDWVFPYYRGFFFMYFKKDYGYAYLALRRAAGLPDAPPTIATFAEKVKAKLFEEKSEPADKNAGQ